MFWMFFRSQTVSWASILHHLGPTIITCPIKSLSAQPASNGQHMPRTRQRKRLAAICTNSARPLTTQACQTFSSQPTSEYDLKAEFISMKLLKHRAAPHVKRMRARDNPHSKRSVEKACQALRCPLFKRLRFSEGFTTFPRIDDEPTSLSMQTEANLQSIRPVQDPRLSI